MIMFKRILLPVTLLLSLLLSAGAVAQTADATIVVPTTTKVTAPFPGTLKPFDLQSGDSVSEGELLFSYSAQPVRAPLNGKVAAVFAGPGDDADGITARYGSLATIEAVHPFYIDADTKQAYDRNENKYVHVGEKLTLKLNDDKGTGIITKVDGEKYTVEVLSGDFHLDDTVRCFREESTPNNSEIGRGKIKRYPDIQVKGQGRIASVSIAPGTMVSSGDLCFETVDITAPRNLSLDISAPVSGVVTALPAKPGDSVQRGQVLCEISDLTGLELNAEVDEMDMLSLHPGDPVEYTIDAYGDRVFTGTVIKIFRSAFQKQNAAYFNVRVTLPKDVTFHPGMNGTLTIKNQPSK